MDEHTLNDLLECSVCLDRLDTSSKVLPCQHTFCLKCLKVIFESKKELRCPECRILVKIPIDELPPNVLLMRILEGMKNAANSKNPQQSHVEESQQVSQGVRQKDGLLPQMTNQSFTANERKDMHISSKDRTEQCVTTKVHSDRTEIHASGNQNRDNNRQPIGVNNTQPKRFILPHAYALMNFQSNEPHHLNFKKGDLILLKRNIDKYWCFGQCNGKEGAFPYSYVMATVPLPNTQAVRANQSQQGVQTVAAQSKQTVQTLAAQMPQTVQAVGTAQLKQVAQTPQSTKTILTNNIGATAQGVALYDFKMGPNEDEGCLNFKKGTTIQVLRRVDQNWMEGRIGSQVGIFPIAFVELNTLAKRLMQSHPERVTSTDDITNNSNTLKENYNLMNSSPTDTLSSQQAINNRVNVPTSTLNPSRSFDSLYTRSSSPCQTLPRTVNPNNLSNSPSNETNSVRFREIKRHSLHSLTSPNMSFVPSNRHSAEILSVPNLAEQCVPSNPTTAQGNRIPLQQGNAQTNNQRTRTMPENNSIGVTAVKSNSTFPILPWTYIALYPYKPRKNDELELEKGCLYLVTERCLDGWFKGKNRNDISGVFPGNYVAPLRFTDQQQQQQQPGAASMERLSLPANFNNSIAATSSQGLSKSSNHLENTNNRREIHYPDLPPRVPANENNSSIQWVNTPTYNTSDSNVNRNRNQNIPQMASPTLKDVKEHETTTKETSSTSSALNLMKRLASIKSHSKSKNNHTPKPDQIDFNENVNQPATNFNDKPAAMVNSLKAVHVRSGSCPSQLLHTNPPNHSGTYNENLYTQQQTQVQMACGSQRITKKERPSLVVGRKSLDGSALNIYHNTSQVDATKSVNSCQNNPLNLSQNIQQKHLLNPQILQNTIFNSFHNMLNKTKASQNNQTNNQLNSTQQNLMNSQPNNQDCRASSNQNKYLHHISQNNQSNQLMNAPQIKQNSQWNSFGQNSDAIAHRKSSSFDASCILNVGSNHISESAIKASATSKSPYGATESRVRCTVHYPPNSEVELELEVGDIIYVHGKHKNGWFKGTHSRTNKTGLFPASFVEPDV